MGAISTINSTLHVSHLPLTTFTYCEKIRDAYCRAIKHLIDSTHSLFIMAIGAVLVEPWQCIKAGLICLANLKRNFNFYSLNPQSITEQQAQKSPILLLHGNFLNQATWLSLAGAFKKSNLGPVYTVNLPCGDIQSKDFEVVARTIEKIKEHYRQHNVEGIHIDLVGHSRGGELAQRIAWSHHALAPSIGKVVMLGSANPTFTSRAYEIRGRYDVLISKPFSPPTHQLTTINTGHMGLLFSSEAHQQIIDYLSRPINTRACRQFF